MSEAHANYRNVAKESYDKGDYVLALDALDKCTNIMLGYYQFEFFLATRTKVLGRFSGDGHSEREKFEDKRKGIITLNEELRNDFNIFGVIKQSNFDKLLLMIDYSYISPREEDLIISGLRELYQEIYYGRIVQTKEESKEERIDKLTHIFTPITRMYYRVYGLIDELKEKILPNNQEKD